MINLDEKRKRADDWTLSGAEARNDVDELCDEVEKLRNELILAKAHAEACGSQMLDLQQDCIKSNRLLKDALQEIEQLLDEEKELKEELKSTLDANASLQHSECAAVNKLDEVLDVLRSIRNEMTQRVDKEGYFVDGYIEEWHDELDKLIR